MINEGILNPNINSLLSRIRHTNTFVISDRGFPFWPQIETVDISLVAGIPRVVDVLRAIRANFSICRVFMAEEFGRANEAGVKADFEQALKGLPVILEPHVELKKRVPLAIGLIRTGDTAKYGNLILESGNLPKK
ncbi:MAG: RbsD/FucU domain-containing protein [Bryobacteraceae bacterium]|jgi:D-ribose pyranase